MPKLWSFALVAALMLSVGQPAQAAVKYDLDELDLEHAEQTLSKGGPALQALINPATGGVGYMGGGRGVGYLSEHFYLGGAGYGGVAPGGGGLGYGGLLTGYEQKIGSGNAFDVSLLVGGGGGTTPGASGGGSLALQPEVSFSQLFGSGMRGTVGVGYLYMPNTPNLSGVTAGLRLEFKSLTLALPIDE